MDFNDMFGKMYGKLASGMCRLSMNGDIAVKTSNGYKTYNVKTGRLVNQANFVFNIGEEFFFVFPTNRVKKGDIVLIGGTPKCVIKADENQITAIDYESGEVKTLIPERHVFMGKTYFYGKIISMFGDNVKGKVGKIFKYMAMMQMFSGGNTDNNGTNNMMGNRSMMMPMMMFGGDFGKTFGDMFNFDDDTDEDDVFDLCLTDIETAEPLLGE